MGASPGSDGFEEWYLATYPGLLNAMTVVAANRDIARDAVSEAFVRALERWTAVGAMASPSGWVYRVALNVLRRRARRAELERRLLLRRARATAATASSVAAELPASLAPEVWAAVASLPPRQRTAIALRYVLDLPEAQVAQLMGVARGTVSATLVAARDHLRARLSDPGADGAVTMEAHT